MDCTDIDLCCVVCDAPLLAAGSFLVVCFDTMLAYGPNARTERELHTALEQTP